MSVFVDIKGTSVNISKIKEIGIARKDAIRITFDDGNSKIYSVYGEANKEIERFKKSIIQLMPCSAPFFNVYENPDGGYFYERVEFLALCADGAVRSLSHADAFFELADEAVNFIGCFEKKRLYDFPISPN